MILGPTARPFVVLGGEFARSVRRRGELVMAFQYVNTEPAMVIRIDNTAAKMGRSMKKCEIMAVGTRGRGPGSFWVGSG